MNNFGFSAQSHLVLINNQESQSDLRLSDAQPDRGGTARQSNTGFENELGLVCRPTGTRTNIPGYGGGILASSNQRINTLENN